MIDYLINFILLTYSTLPLIVIYFERSNLVLITLLVILSILFYVGLYNYKK